MSDARSGSPRPDSKGDPLPDIFEAHITGTEDDLKAFLTRFDVDVGCRHAHVDTNPDRTQTLLVYATEERIREIGEAGYAVKTGDNVSAIGRERQKEIGQGDRFEGGRTAPRGLGDLDSDKNERSAK